MKCTNCGNEFEGNFCPVCGTPAEKSSPAHHVCSQCGKEYDGNFCPSCGTPASGANPTPVVSSAPAFVQPRSQKKHGCLIAVLVVVFFCIVIGVIGSGSNSTTNSTQTPAPIESPAATATEEPAETLTPTESPALSSAENDVADSASTSDSTGLSLTMDEMGPLLDSIICQNFDEDKYTLEYDDSGVTLSLWEDGLSLGAALAASGNADAKTAWDEMTDNIIYMSNSMTDAMDSMGIQNTIVTINILNEQNPDNVLLCVMNGVVVYDSTEE